MIWIIVISIVILDTHGVQYVDTYCDINWFFLFTCCLLMLWKHQHWNWNEIDEHRNRPKQLYNWNFHFIRSIVMQSIKSPYLIQINDIYIDIVYVYILKRWDISIQMNSSVFCGSMCIEILRAHHENVRNGMANRISIRERENNFAAQA